MMEHSTMKFHMSSSHHARMQNSLLKWTVMIQRIRVVYVMNQYTVILCIPELTTTKMLQLG